MVPNLYKEGFVIATEDSRKFGSPECDYELLRLVVVAQEVEEDGVTRGWEMVVGIEIEVIEIDKNGDDQGFHDQPREVYRMPFPEDFKLRVGMLRLFKKYPKFYKTDIPFGPTPRWLSNK